MSKIAGFYLRSQVTPYVILFIERDGSTYLSSLLMSHPEIEAVYERFAVLKQKGASAQEQLAWARAFFTPPLVGRKGAVGFKTKLVDVLDLDGFAHLLRQKGCRVIQMQRRNRVKAVISRINARRLHDRSGTWNLYKEEDRMPPMTVDLQEFAQFLKEREDADNQLNEYVRQLALPTLLITYEELMTGRDAVLSKVFDFLNVPHRPVEGKTLKHTSDNLRDVVLNFDELRACYANTPYEGMFDEVLVPAGV